MSTATEGFLRGLGVAVIVSALAYFSNSANLTGVVPSSAIAIVAALAGMLDQYFSPAGTVLAGTIGKPR